VGEVAHSHWGGPVVSMQLQRARWLAAMLLTIALIIVINGVPG
jgi:hypothetical protein